MVSYILLDSFKYEEETINVLLGWTRVAEFDQCGLRRVAASTAPAAGFFLHEKDKLLRPFDEWWEVSGSYRVGVWDTTPT